MHFSAIAKALEEDDDARRREALALSAGERIRIGLELAEPLRTDPAIEAELDRRALGQAGLHARWLSLKGL